MIKTKVINKVGIIYLDRPKQLNSLNLQMIRKINDALHQWESDDDIRAVLFDSVSEKGFSAGGDLKEIYSFITDESIARDGLFVEEFILDKYINAYQKPIIGHWYGVTMGGGIGLTITNDFVITDETVNWAMPESILGFTPDVGMGKYFSDLPQAIGQYVPLVGVSLEPYDLIKYDLADLSINSASYDELIQNFFDLSLDYEGDELLAKFKEKASDYEVKTETSEMENNLEKIEKHFSKDSIQEVVASLEEAGDDEFAKKTLAELKKRDPFTLAVQFEKYFICKDLSYDQTLDLDLEIMRHSIEVGDMIEGIRAKMIDKDNKPAWRYKSVEDVDISKVKEILDIKKHIKKN